MQILRPYTAAVLSFISDIKRLCLQDCWTDWQTGLLLYTPTIKKQQYSCGGTIFIHLRLNLIAGTNVYVH